jgi:pyruvate dehydrogenase E1 component alpha subunit
MWTAERLIAFEDRIKTTFINKLIQAPIHLSGGNEQQLLEIFERVNTHDFVFSTWRSHYHALLKGISEEEVYRQIIAGRSMYLMSKPHRFFCSSIVGGILPIACGVALGIKRQQLTEKVWVFIGDMTAETGIYHEFIKYCQGFNLPINVVIEDNGLSTNTPTKIVWGTQHGISIHRYNYQRSFPHVGVGQHVNF